MNVRYIIFTLIGILIIISFNCAHLKEAQQAYSEKQYQQTITLCQTAIQTDSTDAEAYFLTGKCYHALKKPLKALPFTLKAYELNPSSNKIQSALIDLYMNLGDNAQKNNDPNRALYYFKKAEIINPAHFYLIKKIGNLSFKQGYLEHAKERYILLQNEYPDSSYFKNQLLAVEKRHQEAIQYFEKGKTAFQKKQYKTARSKLSRALKLKADFNNAEYYFNLTQGILLYKKGSKNACWEAIDFFGKAMIIQPENAEPHFHMAQAYEKKDQYEFDNAIDEYKTALELDPVGPYSKTCKKRIKALKLKKNKYDAFWGN